MQRAAAMTPREGHPSGRALAAHPAEPQRSGVRRSAKLAAALALLLGACGGDDVPTPPPAPAPLAANLLWDVRIASATLARTDNGSPWDGNGSGPDAYAVFDDTVHTSTRSDTWTPVWSPAEGVARTTSQLETVGVKVQLFDSDFLFDEPMNEARTFVLTDDRIRAQGFTVEGWGGAERVVFTITPHL
jgi:hypothetical protein